MRTGRPRGFCTDTALDRAMNVFWRKGYEGASLADLTEAMAINPPSLYAAFGSKEGLFRAVLERYDARRRDFMEKVITAPDAQTVAKYFLEGVAEFAADTSGLNPPGCLLVQSGMACANEEIPDEIAKHRAEKETALRQRFEQARKDGDLPRDANPETLARYVLDGVEQDQLYILPYPEFRGTLEDIHMRVMTALARPEDDPEYEKRVAHGVPGGERKPARAAI